MCSLFSLIVMLAVANPAPPTYPVILPSAFEPCWEVLPAMLVIPKATAQGVTGGCLCTDDGEACDCADGECGCADCPPAEKATPPSQLVTKRLVTKREFVGWTYVKQNCDRLGCETVRVPMYREVQVEE